MILRKAHSLAAVLLAVLLVASCGQGPGYTPPTVEAAPLTPALPAGSTGGRHEPTAASPAPAQTPLPSPSAPEAQAAAPAISPDNAGRVALLARLGRGALQDVAWLPAGQTIAVAHYAGLSLHDAGTLDERRFIPAYGWKAGLVAGNWPPPGSMA